MRVLTKATKEQKSLVKNRGAELVVDCLVEQGVTHVFGIPGAKIDAVFDVYKIKDLKLSLPGTNKTQHSWPKQSAV